MKGFFIILFPFSPTRAKQEYKILIRQSLIRLVLKIINRRIETFHCIFSRGHCSLRASAANTPTATTPVDVSTAGDETSMERNPENGRRRDFGRRRQNRQSRFQHTDRPRPSSPELFSKDLCSVLFIRKYL